MIDITFLPAREGDAIWIKWGQNKEYQMLIDMGTEKIGKRIRELILSLPEEKRIFELLVVTHVDRDHIGGVLTCFAEADVIPGLEIKDIWFNGYEHITGRSVNQDIEGMGAAQGERLTSWLRNQQWNSMVGGKAITNELDNAEMEHMFPDDLKITILGPSKQRLSELQGDWENAIKEALRKGAIDEVSPGLEGMGSEEPPVLSTNYDLEVLAESNYNPDNSPANGSSIVLLVEYKGFSSLFSGDAFSEDLIKYIADLRHDENPYKVNLFKLPHHGSKNNISKELVESIDPGYWVFSSDGNRFKHPDSVAIARVLHYSRQKTPVLAFNTESKYNLWWDNESWKNKFNYEVKYGDSVKGIKISTI